MAADNLYSVIPTCCYLWFLSTGRAGAAGRWDSKAFFYLYLGLVGDAGKARS